MQRSFINIVSIGSLWDSVSFFKIQPMPTIQNISTVQKPTSVQSFISDSWLSNTKLANVFGRYSTFCLHFKPKLTSHLLGERKGGLPPPPPTTRGFRMKYDSITFLLNSNWVQFNVHFFFAQGSLFQWNNDVLFCLKWIRQFSDISTKLNIRG